MLLNEDLDLFDRYAAMFALRNRGSPEAVDAIVATLAARSALLRHEVDASSYNPSPASWPVPWFSKRNCSKTRLCFENG